MASGRSWTFPPMVTGYVMNTNLSRSRTYDEIRITVTAIAEQLTVLSGDYYCVIHSIQQHRHSYYQKLEGEFRVPVLLCGQSKGLKAALSKSILGSSAMILLKDYDLLSPIFFRISEQALAAIYAVRKRNALTLTDLAQLDSLNLVSAVRRDTSHFSYQVDEDAADSSGLIPEVISMGSDCARSLSDVVHPMTDVG